MGKTAIPESGNLFLKFFVSIFSIICFKGLTACLVDCGSERFQSTCSGHSLEFGDLTIPASVLSKVFVEGLTIAVQMSSFDCF